MKILKRLFFLCIALGNYQFVLGMDAPRKIKPPRSTEINSNQLSHIQNHNKKSVDTIEDLLGTSDENVLGVKRSFAAVSDANIKTVAMTLAKMKENTPLKSKNKIVVKHIKYLQKEVSSDNNVDSIEKNNRILNTYNSPAKSKLIAIFAGAIGSPEARDYSVVDIPHVMGIKATYDDKQNLIKISGGHSFEEYLNQNFIKAGSLLLIASDNKTIGFDFGNGIDKTLYLGLTENMVLDNLKFGETIAKSSGDETIRVSLIGDDRYVESFQSSSNPLLYPTIFPLFVVNQKNTDEFGNIYLGKFARLNSEHVLEDETLDLYNERKLFIPPSDFNSAMLNGKKFKPHNGINIVFADITDELNNIFKIDLKDLGMEKFPVPIYGISDNRE